MKKIVVSMMMGLFLVGTAGASPVTGKGVSTDIPQIKRHQYYSPSDAGFPNSTSITFTIKEDLGRSGMIGYVFNNSTSIAYLLPNYVDDPTTSMGGIKVEGGFIFNFSPANLQVDTLKIRSSSNVNVDLLIH